MFLFYSSDGQYIYFNATDNKLRFLNTQTYQIDYTRQDQKDYVQYGAIAISISGNLLVNDAIKNELRIINTQTKETIQSIPVSTGGINSLTFSPDEKYLAVNFGQGKVIKVYDLQTGQSIYEYTTVPSGYALTGIGISHDQKYLVSSSGYIFLYKFLPTTGVEKTPEQKEDIIYPNPTNGSISVRFNLPMPGFTKISAFDNTGREVKSIFQGPLDRGEQNISSDIRGIKAGTYFIKVSSVGTEITFKLIINK
jgi:WD40 repeat protein